MLDDRTTPDDIMQALAVSPDYKVRSFALAVPSLNDIFIRVAGTNNHKEGMYEPQKNMANRPS